MSWNEGLNFSVKIDWKVRNSIRWPKSFKILLISLEQLNHQSLNVRSLLPRGKKAQKCAKISKNFKVTGKIWPLSKFHSVKFGSDTVNVRVQTTVTLSYRLSFSNFFVTFRNFSKKSFRDINFDCTAEDDLYKHGASRRLSCAHPDSRPNLDTITCKCETKR